MHLDLQLLVILLVSSDLSLAGLFLNPPLLWFELVAE